jgi:hypothetical protein
MKAIEPTVTELGTDVSARLRNAIQAVNDGSKERSASLAGGS